MREAVIEVVVGAFAIAVVFGLVLGFWYAVETIADSEWGWVLGVVIVLAFAVGISWVVGDTIVGRS